MKNPLNKLFSLFTDKDNRGGGNLISRRSVIVLIFLALSAGVFDCSSPSAQLPSPEERLNAVRQNMEKHRYELAQETLEELRPATAGTRLGGEVQFLLAENRFLQGKYAEAEVEYGTYLALHPEGPFSEKALYRSAYSKIRQIRKIAIGFFTFRSYIPHDRDVSAIVEARSLFELYLDRYPSGEWNSKAKEMADELLIKEGEHGLQIISFYLKKKQPQAALARVERLLENDYPEQIRTRARELADQAGELLTAEADAVSP